jgi:iron complex transport system substrate-binding protein
MLASFALLLVAAAACGSETDNSDQTPVPNSSDIQVIDILDRVVVLDSLTAKIVTVSPTATEILYALGGTAVARDSSSTFPPEVESVPTVGGAYSPSYEAIAALQPDVVLIEALTQGHLIDSFIATGAKVIAVRAASIDDVKRSVSIVGQLLGEDESGKALIERITESVDSARNSVVGSPSFLILISDADRNIYAAKPESYPGAVASVLGLSNLAAGMPDGGLFPGFALLSVESMLTLNPDYLFTITPAPPPAPRLSESLPRIPGIGDMAAVSGGRLYELDSAVFLNAPGPRITDAVTSLAGFVGDGS